MIKLFLDSAVYIKVFSSAFTGLAGMSTGAFYHLGNNYWKNYVSTQLEIYKKEEVIIAKEKQLAKLRETYIP